MSDNDTNGNELVENIIITIIMTMIVLGSWGFIQSCFNKSNIHDLQSDIKQLQDKQQHDNPPKTVIENGHFYILDNNNSKKEQK